MTAVIIDSDVLIEVFRAKDTKILDRWAALIASNTVVLYSPVTVAEVWHGARPSEHSATSALFSALICSPIDEAVGKQAGEYLARYAKSHHLELGDALIASAATRYPAQLWTRNRKHYPMTDVEFY
ncbi:MAG: type II toxin-antitoxin system VapC family toxin [Bryobacterales bacterium]